MNVGWPSDLTAYKLLTDWGSLIGGILALFAGAAAYIAGYMQASATREAARLQVEAMRQSAEREVEALRRSIATEMRIIIALSLGAHATLKKLAMQTASPITARMVESSSRVPAAVIYAGSSHKIGLLSGSVPMEVVTIYNGVELARDATERVMRSRTPDDITRETVVVLANAFLEACKHARGVLPKLRTGVAFHDDKDTMLIANIDQALAAWEVITKRDQESL